MFGIQLKNMRKFATNLNAFVGVTANNLPFNPRTNLRFGKSSTELQNVQVSDTTELGKEQMPGS